MFIPDTLQSSRHPLLILQSSVAQSTLSLLRKVIETSPGNKGKHTGETLLFCLLHLPSSLINQDTTGVTVYDRIGSVPGYDDSWIDPRDFISNAVENCPSQQLHVVIDSVDTLLSDIGSAAESYKFLRKSLVQLLARPGPSRLTLHLQNTCPLLPLLVQTSFSSTLAQLIAHPPALLLHLATEYLTPPPPASPEPKFWGVFLPVSERESDLERIIFGQDGEGSGASGEFVVEVILRGGGDHSGRRKAVERVLEGWDVAKSSPVELTSMESLKKVFSKTSVEEAAPDPTQNLSFNLNLTPSQQQARSQVPLPYAHEGKALETPAPTAGSILYDPDSADDIDDDDPDEDLDI
ncbi:uncharacterized protein EV420DRAFT_939817 [Desarmillaria tabescens]|uniref:Elongator complex protein 5 n=1 Tax=Armillaria tabescens TaxID=1929756 RepID=A0AA39NGC5_ARMTA|nr:uncharacterized protein EV420DRAFT_939817 [Desarmillaria tabescens]KAK0465110.1 hypothetical protein EV420DRAFT_939817 [Desarmillaria tabescens]